MHLALVTAADVDPAATDDRYLQAALAERGHAAEWIAWDDSRARWAEYDCVLLRSCWGYHREPEKFRAWVERCARRGVMLVNPPSMLLHNMHKHYLLELAAAGNRIPPLKFLRRGTESDLAATLALLGGDDAVIKPAVSGTAWHTWRVRDRGIPASQTEMQRLLLERDMLVQRYEPGVTEQGEWSLVYLGGFYSHAVLKQPKPGDFRSQGSFGGSVHDVEAPPALRDAAGRALALLGNGAAYARVDMIDSPQGALLMEVELIEPVLFFAARPLAAQDLVAHLEWRIAAQSSRSAQA